MDIATVSKSDVAATVRRLRADRGWGQEQLAAQAKVSPRTISYLESGARRPRVLTLARLAKALDVPLSTLLGEEE